MKRIILSLAVALIVSSCSDSSSPDSTPVSYKVPGTGSTFTYNTYDTDEQGTRKPGSERERIESVIASNITFEGESGIWVVQGADTAYYRIDQYNDVQMRVGGMQDAFFNTAWIRLPYSSGVPSSTFVSDKTTKFGVVYQTIKTITAERMTQQSFPINGAAVNAYEFKIVYSIVVKGNESIETDVQAVTYVWFAPSLGTVIRRVTPAQGWFGIQRDGHVEEMGSYNVK
ncbi:MAG: hypothetical protein ACK45E_03115 [Ignavibacteria bacterium]|jgi:hypothetical protein